MSIKTARHLAEKEKIKLGSFYTPENLVNLIKNFINQYLKKNNLIILDSSAGYGSFIDKFCEYNYRSVEYDKFAYKFLNKNFNKNKVFYGNSLRNVSRSKYNISNNSFLIIVGNPPYNDTTSEFRNGEKGKNKCDEDLYDRDLGISFLKSYLKLNADIVAVLHPLSYLIKKTNFKRLKQFKDFYLLKKGVIFSSSLFNYTGSIKFPIVATLYSKDKVGMDYDYIKNFSFNIFNKEKIFKLKNFNTTDGYIRKYPPRKNDIQESPIGLYYYTFRDINTIKKNTTFLNKKHYNGIVVTVQNFYKYCYLYSFKKLFNPVDIWIYGNLSPLVNIENLEKNKKIYIEYAFRTCPIIFNLTFNIKKKIYNYYSINPNSFHNKNFLVKKIKSEFRKLV